MSHEFLHSHPFSEYIYSKLGEEDSLFFKTHVIVDVTDWEKAREIILNLKNNLKILT